MQHILPPILIMSAEREEFDVITNWIKNKLVGVELETAGLTYRRVKGTYRGKEENSFVVFTSSFRDIEPLLQIAEDFYQETVLVIDVTNRDSYLLDTDTRNVIQRGSYSVGNKKPEGDYTEITKDKYLEALL